MHRVADGRTNCGRHPDPLPPPTADRAADLAAAVSRIDPMATAEPRTQTPGAPLGPEDLNVGGTFRAYDRLWRITANDGEEITMRAIHTYDGSIAGEVRSVPVDEAIGYYRRPTDPEHAAWLDDVRSRLNDPISERFGL